MTNSLDGTSNTTAAKEAFLAKIKSGEIESKPMSERTNLAEIPRWVKIAVARKEILGYTWRETMDDINRAESTLKHWLSAPAVKQYREDLREMQADPVQMGALILRADMAEVAVDYLASIEAAKRAGDYKEVRLGLKDLLKTHNLIKDSDSRRDANTLTINVTLDGTSLLDAPEVKSSFSYLEAEVIDE